MSSWQFIEKKNFYCVIGWIYLFINIFEITQLKSSNSIVAKVWGVQGRGIKGATVVLLLQTLVRRVLFSPYWCGLARFDAASSINLKLYVVPNTYSNNRITGWKALWRSFYLCWGFKSFRWGGGHWCRTFGETLRIGNGGKIPKYGDGQGERLCSLVKFNSFPI